MLHVIMASQDQELAKQAQQRMIEAAEQKGLPVKTYTAALTDDQRQVEGRNISACTFEAPEDIDFNALPADAGPGLLMTGIVRAIPREDWIQELTDEIVPEDE